MPKPLFSTLLAFCLCGGGVTLAIEKPGTQTPASHAADEAGKRLAAQTLAAIRALGANPSSKQISTIVFKTVRSSPEHVLVIVAAAARVAPGAAVSEIVTAAVAAVPNPWKQVTYRRLAALDRRTSGPDYKGGPDGKQARDGGPNLDLGGRSVGDPGARSSGGWAGQHVSDPAQVGDPADGIIMTLAEAIARAAFDAQPGLSFSALTAAVDIALRTDPATLLRDIQSPNSVSGVGDAGLSNYANEPLRTPKQPVVSR